MQERSAAIVSRLRAWWPERADRDKPHRCPNCWRSSTWGKPFRKWRIYVCEQDGTRFAWWGR